MFSELGRQAFEYMLDTQQRTLLFWDVIRQSSDQYIEHISEDSPPVLIFEHELVVDGRDLPSPVNYGLLRIVPSKETPTDPNKRPFVIIDPRAGHGPGVAGSKIHSEIGAALASGHACYFVTFAPYPEDKQTIADVLKAEKHFLEVVAQRHPAATCGKPFLVGNCQGGWALFMLASAAPELVGPIMLAGTPLSYWAGRAGGQNPMRYTGGMLGGTWMSSLASDLGHGLFDGVYLIDNFENLNPANTFWSKPYHLYANIDTEAERYLGFDRWWSAPFFMTRKEIDWIVQNLFVGNRLSKAELPDPIEEGVLNPRNIRTPIIVFASAGDNITPPPQALNWILDLYKDEDDLRLHEQVIVYNIHQSTGHLGIFVSSGVADREHSALFSALDLVELLPPGLYEARIEDLHPDMPYVELIEGRHTIVFEPRTFDDLRSYDDGREDERAFEVVQRVSEINQHVYDLAVSPIVQHLSSAWSAQSLRFLHPKRLGRYMCSSLNPWAALLAPIADQVKQKRLPLDSENVFSDWEQWLNDSVVRGWDAYRDIRDQTIEMGFKQFYGSPWLRAFLGLDDQSVTQQQLLDRDVALQEELKTLRQQIELLQINEGGTEEALARLLIYMADQRSFVDERAFNLLERLHEQTQPNRKMPNLDKLKAILRTQWSIMQKYPTEAIQAIPRLVPAATQRQLLWEMVTKIAQLHLMVHRSPHFNERFAVVACALGLCSEWEPVIARTEAKLAAGSMPDLTQTRLVVADEYGAHAVKPPKPQQQTAEQKVVASTPVAKRTPSKSTRKHSAKTPLKAAKKTKS